MKKGMILAFAAACCIAGCARGGAATASVADAQDTVVEMSEVPYVVADRYFVRNDVDSLPSAKIDSQEMLDSCFGMATVMGENGRPTEIDFLRQYAIAVDMPVTDVATELVPLGLEKDGDGNVVFSYRVERGEKRSYSIRPLLMVVVDRRYDGNVVLREVE